MVDIQKTQEGIDLIRPGNDIRNVGYTSRRINQKMQVMNTYLDSDKAESTDMLPQPQGSGELTQINHFKHTVLGKNDFGAKGQGNIYIPADGTYMLKCTFSTLSVDEYEIIRVVVIKNGAVDDYPQDIILELYFVSPMGYPSYTETETEVVNLSKGDILTVGACVETNGTPYPVETRTTVDLIKLS